ncbi:MAG: M23 family metallopeptidase [Cyclobacteriaceae bacterium]
MNKLVISFIYLLHMSLYAQEEVKVFTEKKDNGYMLYASNLEFCPVSISLEVDLTNMNFTQGEQKLFVIPARIEKFKLGELTITNKREASKYSTRYLFTLGDVTKKNYDTTYIYDLPYQKGKQFMLFQGYNGLFSHQNENALDFTMPEGSEIVAARDGIVIKVVQNNSESCLKEECKKFNNYLSVYQSDGTFADYVHLRRNGVKFKVGDKVRKGELIAYSGNTGWSSGPHLHFVCSLPSFEKRPTIKTKFKINEEFASIYLKEKKLYLKEY